MFLLQLFFSIFNYPNGKTLFKLFAFPYISYHTHEHHNLWPYSYNFSVFPSTFPHSCHSPDLVSIAAQRIMFLGRPLFQSADMLPGGPRPERIWLILDLARNRCPDAENQDNIDNSL